MRLSRPVQVLQDWLPDVVLLAGAAVFLLAGRGRWVIGDDQSLWFTSLEGVLCGGRVFHEVRLHYGPVSTAVLTGVIRTFGLSVRSVAVFEFSVGLCSALLLSRFWRSFLTPVERIVSSVFLVELVFWMILPGNFLYTYSFAAAQGFFLAMVAILLFERWGRRGSLFAAAGAGMIGGIALLTKQEMGAVAAIGIAAMTLCANIPWRRRVIIACVSGSAFFAAAIAIVLIFSGAGNPLQLLRLNHYWPIVPLTPAALRIFSHLQGLARPHWLVANGLYAMLILALGCLFLLLFSNWERVSPGKRAVASLLFTAGVVIAWEGWTDGFHFYPLILFLPLLVLAALTGWQDCFGDPFERWRGGALVAAALGALLLLFRVGYQGNPEGTYAGIGYVLGIPVVVAISSRLARLLGGLPKVGLSRGKVVVLVVTAAVAVRFGTGRLAEFRAQMAAMVPVGGERGTFYFTPGNAPANQSVVAEVERDTRPGDWILIMPPAHGLDFLTGRCNAAFFPVVSPDYTLPSDEAGLLALWERHQPRVIAYMKGMLSLQGEGELGSGWGRRLYPWIMANYSPAPGQGLSGSAPVRFYFPRH